MSALYRERRDAGRKHGRAAPRAPETSDVRRFRGVLAATLAGAFVLGLGLALAIDADGERAPGPLSRSHRRAAIACASCHGDAPLETRCVGCHGPHPSTRAGHRALADADVLGCTRCHAAHGQEHGVAFEPPGTVFHVEGLGERAIEGGDLLLLLERATTVPLVPLAWCQACHEPTRADDPVVRCLIPGQEALGAERPTVCFDEHRSRLDPEASAQVSARERLPAWERARAVAAGVSRSTDEPPRDRSLLPWCVAAIVAAWATWFVRLRVSARRARPTHAQVAVQAAVQPPTHRRLPRIDTSTCIGCSACVDACPYDVLEIRDYIARVERSDDCCGLTLCEQRCPNGSLVVDVGDPVEDRPHVDETLQSIDVPGIYVAGDLTGLPLIRNAINQGAFAVRQAARTLTQRGDAGVGTESLADAFDLAIVGAGPAGLSAALEAKSLGLRFVVFEQGSVAESIRSFPRGKLVFDQPLEVPLVGELWLAESSKEELLGKWLRIVRRHALPVREQSRVLAIAGGSGSGRDAFRLTVLEHGREASVHARTVVLAIGRRGTPRKLPIPLDPSVEARVHYSLADARSFAGRRVIVVGLGDVAMESAVALAGQPGTHVTLVHRGRGFAHGKRRNIAEVQRRIRSGRIEPRWSSEVAAIDPEAVTIVGPNGRERLAWDQVFVMIGSLAPWSFLASIGVRRPRGETVSSRHTGQIQSQPRA